MWYVAQTQPGREASVLERCRCSIGAAFMQDCFSPEREVFWRVRGEWRLVRKPLFPGYLFFVAADPEPLHENLSRLTVPIRLLGNGEGAFFPLADEERAWFEAFLDEHRVARMSEGFIAGERVVVTRGPLHGYERDIRKIDRHRRRAYLDVSLFGRTVPASLGLEIVAKTA